MTAFIPLDPATLCRRWHQATVANSLLQWRSLSHLLAAEAAMCLGARLRGPADDMAALSNVARQRSLDLQPAAELEAA
jgi:hypothetical protein